MQTQSAQGFPDTHNAHKHEGQEDNGKIRDTITGISWEAFAVIAAELIDADAAVTTGIAGALVHVDGALGPGPSWLAGAIITTRLYRQRATDKAMYDIGGQFANRLTRSNARARARTSHARWEH